LARGRYGKQQGQLLKCKVCGQRFSTRRGTPLFDLKTDEQTFYDVIACLAEGNGIRATARIKHVDKDYGDRLVGQSFPAHRSRVSLPDGQPPLRGDLAIVRLCHAGQKRASRSSRRSTTKSIHPRPSSSPARARKEVGGPGDEAGSHRLRAPGLGTHARSYLTIVRDNLYIYRSNLQPGRIKRKSEPSGTRFDHHDCQTAIEKSQENCCSEELRDDCAPSAAEGLEKLAAKKYDLAIIGLHHAGHERPRDAPGDQEQETRTCLSSSPPRGSKRSR